LRPIYIWAEPPPHTLMCIRALPDKTLEKNGQDSAGLLFSWTNNKHMHLVITVIFQEQGVV
jgi:hypothetical protein